MDKTVYLIHDIDQDKLDAVKADMASMGAPTIRVVDCGDHYMAIEGTHRLQAAHDLGVQPDFVVLAQDDMLDASSLDMDYFDADQSYTAGEIAGELHNMRNPVLVFADV